MEEKDLDRIAKERTEALMLSFSLHKKDVVSSIEFKKALERICKANGWKTQEDPH